MLGLTPAVAVLCDQTYGVLEMPFESLQFDQVELRPS
jgi:hypothetical protein